VVSVSAGYCGILLKAALDIMLAANGRGPGIDGTVDDACIEGPATECPEIRAAHVTISCIARPMILKAHSDGLLECCILMGHDEGKVLQQSMLFIDKHGIQ
jgi:hypothetical protein